MLAYLFVLFAIAVRLLPHPFSFTPVGAALLFFGARGPRKHLAVPVVLLVACDFILTKFYYVGYDMNWTFLPTWAWYAAILGLGTLLARRARPAWIVGASLVTALSFFLISNFAVWAAAGSMYPHTMAGLYACYAAAIPFFRNELVSDVFFSAVMFSIPALIRVMQPATKDAAA